MRSLEVIRQGVTVEMGESRISKLSRTALGIVLLALTMGVWACLWVPPLP